MSTTLLSAIENIWSGAELGPVLYLLGGDGRVRWLSNNLHEFCGLDPLSWIGLPLTALVQFAPGGPSAPADPVASESSGLSVRVGKLLLPGGVQRAVRVVEARGEGVPGFGALSANGGGFEGAALSALMGQVAIWRLDLRTLQARAYGPLAESFGYGYDERNARGWVGLFHPSDAPAYQEQLDAVIRGQTNYFEAEARARHRDGRWLWTLSRAEVSRRDEAGHALELTGVTFNFSPQKEAELQLQAHSQLLRRSLRLARVAAWGYDTARGEQLWTDEASALLGVPTGYVPEMLLGLELFDGESQLRVHKAVTRALDEGIGFDQELLRITPQGRVLWVRTVANPEFEGGVMVRLSGLFQDITRQRRMEQAVRDSEQLLKQLTASLPDAIFQLRRTAEGVYHLDFVSEGIRRLLSLPLSGALPDFSGLMDAVESAARAQVLRSLDRAASLRELWSQELPLENAGAQARILMGKAQTEAQLDGSYLFFGFLSDISEQRRQQQALRDAEQTQQRLARVEAVGQLAGGIAHDFNNYLTSIVMSLSLLEAQPELSQDAQQLVREALSATSSAQALTRQLLTFSRGAAPVKQTVDSTALVREAVAFTLRGSAINCRFEHSAEVWPIEVDPGQIQQVLQNLVLNASQAMGGNGQLIIRILNVEPSQNTLGGLKPGPAVRIEVIDTGLGVPEAIRDKLFQPYVTSKEHGSGLGLASAFSIVRRHEGLITHESSAQGTNFSVWLPAQPQRLVVQDLAPALALGSGQVLVMDDNDGILKMLTRALKHLGFEAVAAHDGAQALGLMRRAIALGRPFRAVILDQTIPGGVGGAEALKLLQSVAPEVIAIATSGYTEGDAMARYREFGFAGVLRKPFRIQDLARVLAEVLPDLGS